MVFNNKYFLIGSSFFGLIIAYVIFKRRKPVYEEIESEDEKDNKENDADYAEDKDILVLGLEGSGKSSILGSLSGNISKECVPTNGFNVVSLPGPCDSRLNLFELGGSEKMIQYWRHFYTDKNLVVFVVDASHQDTFETARKVLQDLLTESHLQHLPFILVAHKQDKYNAVDGDAVLKAMNLTSVRRNIFPVQTQTPVSGKHLGMEELKQLISRWAQ